MTVRSSSESSFCSFWAAALSSADSFAFSDSFAWATLSSADSRWIDVVFAAQSWDV